MRVIVPYTSERKGIVDRLISPIVRQEWNDCEFIQLPSEDDAYWKLMSEIWEQREDTVIIEHDVLPWPGAINELLECPYLWCANTYRMKGGYGINHAFGCTKFSGKLMEKFPDIWINFDDTKWNTLDAQFYTYMRGQEFLSHPHRPPVTHLKGIM